MPYPFHIVNVFAEERYTGNQLAVVLNADGISEAETPATWSSSSTAPAP